MTRTETIQGRTGNPISKPVARAARCQMHTLRFETVDMRDQRGFPTGPQGVVYIHHSKWTLPHRYTGVEKVVKRSWVIRTNRTNDGWRIDRHSFGPPVRCPP